jgi:hypothetical protein
LQIELITFAERNFGCLCAGIDESTVVSVALSNAGVQATSVIAELASSRIATTLFRKILMEAPFLIVIRWPTGQTPKSNPAEDILL